MSWPTVVSSFSLGFSRKRDWSSFSLNPLVIDGGNSVPYSLLRWCEAMGLNVITAVLNQSLTYMGQHAKLTVPCGELLKLKLFLSMGACSSRRASLAHGLWKHLRQVLLTHTAGLSLLSLMGEGGLSGV